MTAPRASALLLALVMSVPALAAEREFYVATVHLDGETSEKGDGSHSPEPFPATPIQNSGGLIVRPPNAAGEWSVRAFVFQPAQVTAVAGDDVVLLFVGVHGPSHAIVVDGVAEPVVVRRGTQQSVRLTNVKAGLIGFYSKDRVPSMRGQIVVLPRP